VLILAARIAIAQTAEVPAQAGIVAYDAAFYATYLPRTALDMIGETPGFVLDVGETGERRGFEGSVGNVLIDGERPTAKGEGLAELLRGIPAARVVRIEIRRASDTAGDASGARLLANVVLKPAPWQGAWSGGVELGNRYRPAPNGYGSAAGGIGATAVVVSASSYSLFRDLPGTRVVRDGAGALSATREVSSPRHYQEYTGSGQTVRRVVGGRLEVTAKTSFNWYDDATEIVTAGSVPSTERVPYGQHERSTEAGASYKRAARGWEWTALSLLTWKHFDSHVTSTHDAGPPASPLVKQTSRRDTLEIVVRLSAARARPRGTFQVGVEGVRNTLDGLSALTRDLGAGSIIHLPVANALVHVVEDRGEVFASQAWRPDARWSVDGRLGVEFSNLRFQGDVTRAVTLAYAKPSVSVTHTFSNQTQVHGRLLRTIGQLNFADFVATASLADEQWTGSNPELRPETSWRAETGADLRLRDDIGIRLLLFHDWLDNVVDWTVWGEEDGRVDVRGNVGSGQATGATISYQSPVPTWPGLSFSAAVMMQRARVVDPTTGRERDISDRVPTQADLSLRQLLPKSVTLGASYTYRSGTSAYRLEEIDWKQQSPQLDAFVEWPLTHGLRLKTQCASLLGQHGRRRRTFFDPDRSQGVSGYEEIASRPGRWFVVSLSGSF
jgi:hypothetical protein